MSSDSTTAIQRRKRRVGVACDFCRQRKLGCDNAQPKCENCHVHQRDCTYAVRIKKERPSNSQINHLKEENTRLRKLVEKLQSLPNAEQPRTQDKNRQIVDSELSASLRIRDEALSREQRDAGVSQPSAPNPLGTSASAETNAYAESQETQFHGPSSAMSDGMQARKRNKISQSHVVDASQKIQLLAGAAKQRQLELVNFRSGKLRFEGIEPDLLMDLLSVFWNRQHATGSVVYRPCFMRDMANQGPYFSPLLLNAILFAASKHIPGMGHFGSSATDNCDAGLHFRRNIEDMLYDPSTRLLSKSSITTVQALLLISDALFSWCDETSLSWHYLGIATSMIIDLGIHSENGTLMSGNTLSTEDLEVHRRVFWAAFVLDKIQSIYQGRPARLRDMDSRVPILFLDEYEELEPFNTVGYSTPASELGQSTHSVSTFEHLCKLSTIADRILYNQYAEKSSEREPGELFRTSQFLHAELTQWRESLPAHLSISFDGTGSPNTSSGCVALPHTLCLLLMFHALIILLHRPFVPEGHLKSVAASTASDAFSICETAASDIDVILRWYRTQFCIKLPPYFLSYATYVSATIHVRLAAQSPPKSKAHRCLRNCLETLSEHQKMCHAPRRAMGILLGLVKRLNVDVGSALTASVSRTGGCQVAGSGGGNEALDNSSSTCLETLPKQAASSQTSALGMAGTMRSCDLTPGDLTQPSNTRTGSHETPSTHVDGNPLGQIDSGWPSVDYEMGELFTDMSFDLDPLFGFDITQIDPGPDLGF